nr:MAG TPA: hypothetical protein [Caudoviricetes sp.]
MIFSSKSLIFSFTFLSSSVHTAPFLRTKICILFVFFYKIIVAYFHILVNSQKIQLNFLYKIYLYFYH